MGFVVVACETESVENFAGIVGIGINQGLCTLTGKIGCGIVLLAFTITVPMLLFGVKYLWVKQMVLNIAQNTANTDNNNEQSSKKINSKQFLRRTKKKEESESVATATDSSMIADTEQDNSNGEKHISDAEKEQVKELLRRSQLPISDRKENITVASQPIKLNPTNEYVVSDNDETTQEKTVTDSVQQDFKEENIPFIVKQQSEQEET